MLAINFRLQKDSEKKYLDQVIECVKADKKKFNKLEEQ